jgi:hypothetical protein
MAIPALTVSTRRARRDRRRIAEVRRRGTIRSLAEIADVRSDMMTKTGSTIDP